MQIISLRQSHCRVNNRPALVAGRGDSRRCHHGYDRAQHDNPDPKERGLLKEGWHADINVIDYENLSSCQPEYVNDLPLDGGRFIVKSKGYDATIVAGKVVVENCEYTDATPGTVIRDFIRG